MEPTTGYPPPATESVHKDFHAALSAGIEYLDQHYGEEAVR